MTLRPTGKHLGVVLDAGNNVALRWEGERNVLVGRLSPEAAERLADELRAAAEAARERAEAARVVSEMASGGSLTAATAADICRRVPGCETVAGEFGTGLPTATVHVEPMSGFVVVTQVPVFGARRCYLTPAMARALVASLARVADRAEGRGQVGMAWGTQEGGGS